MKTVWAVISICVAWLATVFPAAAVVLRASDVSVGVSVATSFDTNTGLYTYRYTVTNYGDSDKPVHEFHVPLRGAVATNITAPPGWDGAVNAATTMIGWCACKEEGFVPPAGYVDDGRGLPSAYAIRPGATLAGFSFQSPYPPSPGVFYAGGWIPVPIEGVDFPEGQEPQVADFPMDMAQGAAAGPLKDDTIFAGGRRPAVDGFLVFANMQDGGTYSAPVIVDVLFSAGGEQVQQSTFNATLNGFNVTSRFRTIDVNRRRAVFEADAGSPLKAGRNTLLTSVDGVVPGTNGSATDTDRLVFTVR
jgi:hypothetical protein